MSAPAETPETTSTRVPRLTHKLCARQAVNARLGLPRVFLCGHRKDGPRAASKGTGHVPCPMCWDVVREHRAACPDCQAAGWT